LAKKPSRRHGFGVVVWYALLAALLFQAGMFLLRLFLDITFPYPLDYGEGIALDRAIALANGGSLYLPMDRPPYTSWNFPPLYAWICALGARWVGPGFAFGRLVSAASILVTAACVYLLARRHVEGEVPGASRIWGLVAALLYLGSTPVIIWGALMRVDSLAIALGLSGYTAVVTGLSPVLAGLLFGAAILCKQSVVAGLLAAGLMLAIAQPSLTGMTAQVATARTTEISGASRNTPLLAPEGMIGSLKTNFRRSANDCSSPHGPTTLGPRRNCTAAHTLRSA